ncbi:PTS sugar transporter subunit IIA [Streptococcus parauberis]|uniref:Mannitol-specific phosphotransferase enzyme IIA component n=1 Tax=Streptococcus parauberis KRS-02083 TaxID=1207545 RepID=A0ABN0ISG8_9STRE|nr:PTS sugar transporter subunit IIA [Streptococcus parauberis]AUT06194.1 Protein-N(pi)-phosphohistidine--sugar phosphotransferase [Streptococcus parauberis]EMG25801.1 PTS system mannitol-specific IIA protein [Streptococcus parauberis KRS-02083]UWV09587.1 PTS sugar transporter subunit IIA [Streptococcus parauberis]WEM62078.1 PTS sugar transporter subunit IIA [Streptococcus parauberis]WEM64283.1 PTS sugar transporter subunit IIA [Streptococcus parauberis]
MEFQPELIKLNQSFNDKEEAIRYCGQLLFENGYVEEDYIQAMIDRNNELSVFMGNFIAIPHGTDIAKEKLIKSGLSVVQVPDGVNFGTEEAPQTATVLFGIAGIGDEHLQLIQKISIFCADVDNVVRLADAKTESQIIALLNSVD